MNWIARWLRPIKSFFSVRANLRTWGIDNIRCICSAGYLKVNIVVRLRLCWASALWTNFDWNLLVSKMQHRKEYNSCIAFTQLHFIKCKKSWSENGTVQNVVLKWIKHEIELWFPDKNIELDWKPHWKLVENVCYCKLRSIAAQMEFKMSERSAVTKLTKNWMSGSK